MFSTHITFSHFVVLVTCMALVSHILYVCHLNVLCMLVTCELHVSHVNCMLYACHMWHFCTACPCSHQRRVCRACYRIIEVFLQGDSRKNELYVSRFVPFFEGQVRHTYSLWAVDDTLCCCLHGGHAVTSCNHLSPSLLQMRLGLNAEDMLIELVRDNPCVCV